MMETVCLALGIIIGGALFGIPGFFFGRNFRFKKEIMEAEEKKAEKRMRKQWENFVAYDGTTKGQEDID